MRLTKPLGIKPPAVMQRIGLQASLIGDCPQHDEVLWPITEDNELGWHPLDGMNHCPCKLIPALGARGPTTKEHDRPTVQAKSPPERLAITWLGLARRCVKPVVDDGGGNISKSVARHRPRLSMADAHQRGHVSLDQTVDHHVPTWNPAHRRAMHALGRGRRKADVPARTQELGKAEEQVVVRGEDDRNRPASAAARYRK